MKQAAELSRHSNLGGIGGPGTCISNRPPRVPVAAPLDTMLGESLVMEKILKRVETKREN